LNSLSARAVIGAIIGASAISSAIPVFIGVSFRILAPEGQGDHHAS
jgi:hypothetical protein